MTENMGIQGRNLTAGAVSKDVAARTLLLTLERAGYFRLSARRRPSSNERRNRAVPPPEPIRERLSLLRPIP